MTDKSEKKEDPAEAQATQDRPEDGAREAAAPGAKMGLNLRFS